ncbi:Arc family DNA-binding protein [Gluconobacter wancherniae]|uniref:Arc family DNA-binding protein n=1 Tax=Gluconobacter wancherniae TaxID=1307955 RepID=UPI0038D20B13
MARGDPMLHIRVTDELKSRLEESAQFFGRSMNAEISQRLEESLYLSKKAHALEGNTHLTDGERALVQSFRNMSPDERRAVLALLNKLSSAN